MNLKLLGLILDLLGCLLMQGYATYLLWWEHDYRWAVVVFACSSVVGYVATHTRN